MRLSHLLAGLAFLAVLLSSGCYCPRACYRPCGPACPPAVTNYPIAPACPCNGGPGVTAFTGGPPIVTTPYHP
jgi:hypothetical protein